MANTPREGQGPVTPGLPNGEAIDFTVVNSRTRALLQRPRAKQRYLVERELARGGMGVIHVAYDQDLQRVAALKVIGSALVNDERRLKAFVEEARITARLEHPNIIPVHEIGVQRESGLPYYTMKLVEGEALSDIIYRLSQREPEYVRKYNRHALLDIFRKVCYAIAYAHSRGIIHRDIKPENIMVGGYGEVLVMDWGLAKCVDALESRSTSYLQAIGTSPPLAVESTQDGVIKGSLAYLSPEQAFGELSQVDQQTDLFLLGATLYHMFTHYPPYEATTIPEILRKAETCDYLPPSQRNPEAQIPLALDRIILKAMAPLKENRYRRTTDLIDELDAFIAGKRVCGRRIFSPGEDLIRYGDQSQDTFIIISGKVEVFRYVDGKASRIAALGKGEIVGEMSGITHKMRSATVTAVETTEVLVITHDLLLEELEKLPPWMEKIVFSMADRVTTLDQQIHPYLLTSCTFPVLNQVCLVFLGLAAGTPLGSVTMDFAELVYEINLAMALDEKRVARVLEVLIRTHLLALDGQQRAYVPSLDILRLFVDYSRLRLGLRGARRADSLKLTPEQDLHFRSAFRRLEALQG